MALGDPYVTGTELGTYLKLTTSGNETQLTLAATAASRWVDEFCRRQFNLASSATNRVFDTAGSTLMVDDIGHATIAVSTDSGQDGTFATSWAASDFQVDPFDALAESRPITGILAVGAYTFPTVTRRKGLVRVNARWGWPAVPDAVKQATFIQGARLYKRRESAEGVLGFGEFGPVRVGARIDPDVEALLSPYRLAVTFT